MIAGVWDPGGASPLRSRLEAMAPRAVHRAGALLACGEGAPGCLVAGELFTIDAGGLAAAFASAGPPAFDRADGAFAAVAWHEGSAALACDPLGKGTLYLHDRGGVVAFASELRGLLRLLPAVPAIDEEAVRTWLARAVLPRGCSFYAGVERLPAGEIVVLGGKRTHHRRPAASRRAGAPEPLVRDAVVEAVRRCSEPPGGVGVLLSGGLDSTVVASVAARALPEALRPRALYSMRFPGLRGQDETPWIELAGRELGLPAVQFTVRGGSIVAGMLDWTALTGMPLPAPNWHYQRPVLERIAADGVAAVLDGEGGDELFAAARLLVADRVRAGRVLSAARLVRRMPGAPAASTREVARVFAQYGLRPALRAAPGPRWAAQLHHVVTEGIAAVGAHEHFRLRAGAAGLRSRQPLRDLALTELVLGLDPELSFDPRFNRPLLRRSMAGLAPEEVLRRTDKARFEALMVRTLAGEDAPALRLLLADRSACVRRLLPEPWSEPPQGSAVLGWADRTFRAAAVEVWLRGEEDPGALERLGAAMTLAPVVVDAVHD